MIITINVNLLFRHIIKKKKKKDLAPAPKKKEPSVNSRFLFLGLFFWTELIRKVGTIKD